VPSIASVTVTDSDRRPEQREHGLHRDQVGAPSPQPRAIAYSRAAWCPDRQRALASPCSASTASAVASILVGTVRRCAPRHADLEVLRAVVAGLDPTVHAPAQRVGELAGRRAAGEDRRRGERVADLILRASERTGGARLDLHRALPPRVVAVAVATARVASP